MQREKLLTAYEKIKDKPIDEVRVTEEVLAKCKASWDNKFDYLTTLILGMEESAEMTQNLSKVFRQKYDINSIEFLEELADIELTLAMLKYKVGINLEELERVKYIKAQRIINDALGSADGRGKVTL